MNKHWWLKKDCKDCRSYPNCPFVEVNAAKPRGCSSYQEMPVVKEVMK